VFALFGAAAVSSCRGGESTAGTDVVSEARPPDGAQVFVMACARCHGPEGRGDGPLALKLGPVPDLNDADLRHRYDHRALGELVRFGRGKMPPHRDRLSPSEIEAVLTYLGQRFGAGP
jgi:mono/diheme cytochrome c family protein